MGSRSQRYSFSTSTESVLGRLYRLGRCRCERCGRTCGTKRGQDPYNIYGGGRRAGSTKGEPHSVGYKQIDRCRQCLWRAETRSVNKLVISLVCFPLLKIARLTQS